MVAHRIRSGGRRAAVVAVIAVGPTACGADEPPRLQTIARTPADAVRFYNRAIVSGDYAAACRLLAPPGRTNAIIDGRELADPGTPRPTTCAEGLKIVVPPNPEYRKLGGARVVRVRPYPEGGSRVIVTQRFADRSLVDVVATPRARRWFVAINPYSALR
jgi:hypothetical protein